MVKQGHAPEPEKLVFRAPRPRLALAPIGPWAADRCGSRSPAKEAHNVEAKTSIGTALTKRIAPVLNYPNDSISIPCIIEVQRLW